MGSNDQRVLSSAVALVVAFLNRNQITPAELPALISKVLAAVSEIAGDESRAQEQADIVAPAVPIEKSVTEHFIICLEDGAKLKMLKRHLRSRFDMSPEEYRAKWKLPSNYPMVAPAYSRRRSSLAKSFGLGKVFQGKDAH